MKYNNPIIRGFNPDPSICRVGEDYYLVTSTFEYFPGIPIYHSRDLVNWTQIGNCVECAEWLPYEEIGPSGGMWAPTIRYHEGKFYVTATFQGFGNFIISSENPAAGWSKPVKFTTKLSKSMYTADLAFDYKIVRKGDTITFYGKVATDDTYTKLGEYTSATSFGEIETRLTVTAAATQLRYIVYGINYKAL